MAELLKEKTINLCSHQPGLPGEATGTQLFTFALNPAGGPNHSRSNLLLRLLMLGHFQGDMGCCCWWGFQAGPEGNRREACRRVWSLTSGWVPCPPPPPPI